MNRPRLQHYVTRSYLEGFLALKETRLHVYTRGKEQGFRALPANVAAIHNYYSPKKKDGTYDDRIEHMFANDIEAPGIQIIRKLNAGSFDLSTTERVRLCVLLAAQEYRVPWMRTQMEIFSRTMYDRFARGVAEVPGLMEETLRELSLGVPGKESETADNLRRALRNGDVKVVSTPAASMRALGHLLETLPNIYYSMGWEILESKTETFITSDCPVHRYYVPLRTEIAYGGLMDKRVQVRFPLSRSKMLVLRHDRKRIEIIDKLRGEKGGREARKVANLSSDIRHFHVSAEEMKAINAHTASMAARFIFSASARPEGSSLVAGACRNIRHEFIDMPGGITQFRAVYPARE